MYLILGWRRWHQ